MTTARNCARFSVLLSAIAFATMLSAPGSAAAQSSPAPAPTPAAAPLQKPPAPAQVPAPAPAVAPAPSSTAAPSNTAVDVGANVVTLESDALRLEVTANPYSYRVIEKSTNEVLLAQDNTAFTFNTEFYPGTSAVNIARPNDVSLTLDLNLQTKGLDPLPAGTPPQAQVKFTFVAPEQLQITIGFAAPGSPADISEEFLDHGEHYYGIWEYPFGGNIDDRGADRDFLGLGNERYVHHSSTRAPFYLTSRKYGVYVESLAQGHFSIAQAGHTGFDFDAPKLTYDIFYGPTYADIFRRYNAIAGPTVMPPAWAFGSIWWRDDEHEDLRRVTNAQEKVLDDADHLRALHIPAGSIWLDRPYGAGEDGWGGMDFDSSFPDPPKLVHDLNARGIQLLLWISDRASGDKMGTEGAAKGYVFPGYKWPGIDIRRPEVYDWFKGLLGAYVNIGIKGYKIDRGDEGEMPDAPENEIAALMPKLAAESLEATNGDDFFMFARNANDTARRYTAVWSGDSWSSFAGLQMSVKNALRAGAVDYPIWGSDTGGYFLRADKELFARWLEFSSYSPLMEVLIGPNRTVWDDYDDETVAIARDAATTHADLIPYVRSLVYGSRASGLPVMRALVFAFPDEGAALADAWDEYLYGESLLIAPVLEAGARTRTVYLPGAAEPGKGIAATDWLDFSARTALAERHAGDAPYAIYRGGNSITIAAPLGTIPVFVREGAIIPRGDIVQMNNNWSSASAPSSATAALAPAMASSAPAAPSTSSSTAAPATPSSAPGPSAAASPAARAAPAAAPTSTASSSPSSPTAQSAAAPSQPSSPASASSTPASSSPSPSSSPAQKSNTEPASSAVGSAPAAQSMPGAAGNSLSSNSPWAPSLRIEVFPGRAASAFSYFTGTQSEAITVEPIASAAPASLTDTPAPGGFKIEFPDLGLPTTPGTRATVEVYCHASPAALSVTRNGAPLALGKDFTYDAKTMKLTVPFDGATTLIVHGVTTLFTPASSSAPSSAPASARPPRVHARGLIAPAPPSR
jgi:alpha-D-xyloside xylohydrolase